MCLLDVDSGLSISLIQRRRLFAGFAAARRTCRTGVCRTCVERHIGLHIIITLFLFFFLTYVIIQQKNKQNCEKYNKIVWLQ